MKKGFTLVEVLMSAALVAVLFASTNTIMITLLRKSIISSGQEMATLQGRRASLEMGAYIRRSAQAVLLSGGSVTTNAANTLALLDGYGNTNAVFVFTPDSSGTNGVLQITPAGYASPFVYTQSVGATNASSSGKIFSWGSDGVVDYSFNMNMPTGTVYFSGNGRPGQ